ncbi:hypothetical protein J7643_18210 [bacterium]|nr:hypothetical protein [bacterium]
MTSLDRPKLVVTLLSSLYFGDVILHPTKWRLLDSFNLLVHEAGHPLFGFFGEFMGFAGGTLMQLLVPIAFLVSFYRQGQPFSSSLMLFWLGQSLINVSIYAGDAVAMELPLFGAGDRIHDWNWMLGELNLLGATPVIAGAARLLGMLSIILGCLCCLRLAGLKLPVNSSAPTSTRTISQRSRQGRTFRR